MGITEDREKIKEWVPLMVEGRTSHVQLHYLVMKVGQM